MIKELSEQICDELMACAKTFDDDALVEIAEKIDKANNIFCVGLGRSRLSIMGFAMRLMHMGYSVHLVGDVTKHAIQKGDVLIVGSGSGETKSLLGMTQKCMDLGVEICLFTRKPDSTVGKRAAAKLVISAATTSDASQAAVQTIQPMGSLFEQSCLIAYDSIIVYLMRKKGTNGQEMHKRHANLE